MPDSSKPDPVPERAPTLIDPYGREISYLRLSVTDRCDLRCTYCMAEQMTFLPKRDILSLEEMLILSDAFIDRGVRRIRLTGGEPLVRKGILWLTERLGERVTDGRLDEITLTTNGTLLAETADALYHAGVRRINVSLDSLDAQTFEAITRRNRLSAVIAGINAALDVGLKVKINTVAQNGLNDHEIGDILKWCMRRGLDLTLIETMPMGTVTNARESTYLPLPAVLADLQRRHTLTPISDRTGGPARYYKIEGSTTRLGCITPLTGNFCDDCNRMRVTCTGRIYMCLGQSDHLDLLPILRDTVPSAKREQALSLALDQATGTKPRGHDFAMEKGRMTGTVDRHMSHTGG